MEWCIWVKAFSLLQTEVCFKEDLKELADKCCGDQPTWEVPAVFDLVDAYILL